MTKQLRGSYRLATQTMEKGRQNYAGLDRPSRKKRAKTTQAANAKNKEAANHCEAMLGQIIANHEGGTTAAEGEESPRRSRSVTPIALSYPNPDLFSDEGAMNAIEALFQECAMMMYKRFNHGNETASMTKVIGNIHDTARQILDSGYHNAVHIVRAQAAHLADDTIRYRYTQTVYWDIILNGVQYIDESKLSNRPGPSTGFTNKEIEANRRFMDELGLGLTLYNQNKYRTRWKALSDLRKAGVDRILYYRTGPFDTFCERYKNKARSFVETILLWHDKFGRYLELLEDRVTEECLGDSTGRNWLKRSYVKERLDVAETTWNSAENAWFSDDERASWEDSQLERPEDKSRKPKSHDELGGLFDLKTIGASRSRAIFVTLVPQEQRLSVCSVVTVPNGIPGKMRRRLRRSGQSRDLGEPRVISKRAPPT